MPPKIVSGAKRLILGLREKHVELSSDQGEQECALCRFDMGFYFLRNEERK